MPLKTYAPRVIQWVTINPTVLNADAYDANDVVFDKTEVPLASWALGKPVILNDIVWIDDATQAAANLTFWWFSVVTNTFGTADSAPSIADADAEFFLGKTVFSSGNMTALANNTLGSQTGIGQILQPAATTRSLWVAMTTAGTPTFATGCLTIKFGFFG